MQHAPVFSECVIGYRQWRLDAFGQLWALTDFGNAPWVPGVNTAVCGASRRTYYSRSFVPDTVAMPATSHPVPDATCDCGFYSWRRPDDQYTTSAENGGFGNIIVMGAVAVWGALEVHETGFRAEKACIVTLADSDGREPLLRPVLERVAERYGSSSCRALRSSRRRASTAPRSPDHVKPEVSRSANEDLSLSFSTNPLLQSLRAYGSRPSYTTHTWRIGP